MEERPKTDGKRKRLPWLAIAASVVAAFILLNAFLLLTNIPIYSRSVDFDILTGTVRAQVSIIGIPMSPSFRDTAWSPIVKTYYPTSGSEHDWRSVSYTKNVFLVTAHENGSGEKTLEAALVLDLLFKHGNFAPGAMNAAVTELIKLGGELHPDQARLDYVKELSSLSNKQFTEEDVLSFNARWGNELHAKLRAD
jgi:hypothetical protein